MTVELSLIELLFVVVLSALAALCMIASFALLQVPQATRSTTWPLAAVFAILAILAGTRVFEAFGVFKALPVVRAIFLPLLLLGAPLLFWFGRSWSRPPLRFSRQDVLHLIPAGLTLVLLVVMYGDEDGLWATFQGALSARLGVEVRMVDVVRGVYWLFFLQWTVYGGFAVATQYRQHAERRAFFSGVDARVETRMRYVLLFVLVPWASLVIQYTLSAAGYPKVLEPGASLFRIGILAAFSMYAIRQRWIFEPGVQDHPRAGPVTRYQRSGLTLADVGRITGKLETALVEDRLYRNSTLTLRDLSDATQVSENHISETLNVHLGRSFFDFVNDHRIREAERLLVESEDSVLEILLAVGFNARSTFNVAFRKRHGITPTAFRQRCSVRMNPSSAVPESSPPDSSVPGSSTPDSLPP